MLSQEALQSAMPLTAVLDAAGVFLTPIPATPLEAMVSKTRSNDNYVIQNGDSLEPDVANIHAIANVKDPVLGFSPHDIVMDDIVEVASQAVRGHILFAKTVVAPAVQELAEKSSAIMQEMKVSSLLGMEVVTYLPPAPLLNSGLLAVIRKFEEVPIDNPRLNLRLPDVSMEEMVKLMGVGGASLDGDIAEWVSTKGDSFFMTLWEEIFQQRQATLTDAYTKTLRDYIEDKMVGADYALAIFLLARRLYEAPLDGTEMNLRDFETTIIELRNQSAARLSRLIDELDLQKKQGMLVRSIKGYVTVVNGDVYRDWIENGGENEILFGNLINDKQYRLVSQINDHATTLKNKWNRHVALTQTVESNRKFNRIKEILTSIFTQQLVAAKSETEGVNLNREAVLNCFKELLDQVREEEVSNLYGLCLRLVCRSRFAHTDAERILDGIDRVKRENPSVDVREAAAVSVIEYIAYWLSSQFRVNYR